MSEWFLKDEPQRAEAAENRDTTIREANVNSGATFSWRAWEAEYLASTVFWLPPEARLHPLKAKAKSPEIGKVIDDAMGAMERESDVVQASWPDGSGGAPVASRNTGRGRPANLQPGTAALHSKGVLGRVYEHEKFASAEGTLQSGHTSGRNRCMNRVFSLSASNGERIPRPGISFVAP